MLALGFVLCSVRTFVSIYSKFISPKSLVGAAELYKPGCMPTEKGKIYEPRLSPQ